MTTDRDQLDSQLARLTSILDEQLDLLKRWLPDGTVTYVNRAYCEYFGGKPEDVVGTIFWSHLAEGDRSALERQIAGLTPEQPFSTTLCSSSRPDGSRTWLEWIDRGLFDEHGTLLEIQSAGRDVTVREEAIGRLRRSEETYRGLFEQALDAIIVAAPDGRIRDINPAGTTLLGFSSRSEALEHDLGTFLRDPLQRESFLATLAEGGSARETETQLLSHDGRELTVLLTAGAMHANGSGDAERRVILHDITRRRQLAEQLEHSQRLEAIAKLAGGIAHDFNNLLTAIGGNAELLAADFEQGSPRRVAVESIREASEKAVALTQQLLAYARRQTLLPEALDLNRIIEQTAAMLRRIVGEDVEILTRLAPDLGTVEADPQQVKQVIVSLALNAREAMPRGGRLDLQTANLDEVIDGSEVLATGPFVRLTVTDSGKGIPAHHLDRIFEPFFTTKELSLGTGLGLATVYGIVRQSKGYITVRSTVGEGTTFDVYLPRIAAKTGSVDSRGSLTSRGTSGSTILLVEDEPSVRSFLRRVLERHGFRVLDAGAASEALDLYRREAAQISLVLSDVVMPRMNGFRMVDEMVKDVPPRVLFISGYSEETLARQGAPAEPYPLLKKPFSPARLVTKVLEVLDGVPIC